MLTKIINFFFIMTVQAVSFYSICTQNKTNHNTITYNCFQNFCYDNYKIDHNCNYSYEFTVLENY